MEKPFKFKCETCGLCQDDGEGDDYICKKDGLSRFSCGNDRKETKLKYAESCGIRSERAMNEKRQIRLLAWLKCLYSYSYACKQNQDMPIHIYQNFYWDEITDLAELYPQYVRYTLPPTRNMWVSGKHEVLPEIMNWEIPR